MKVKKTLCDCACHYGLSTRHRPLWCWHCYKGKAYTEKDLIRIIGRFYKEGDGWDLAFARKISCCPGDDTADLVTAVKMAQLKKAGIKFSKKDFKKKYEDEAGLVWSNRKNKQQMMAEELEGVII